MSRKAKAVVTVTFEGEAEEVMHDVNELLDGSFAYGDIYLESFELEPEPELDKPD